jgi:hypothetical protein
MALHSRNRMPLGQFVSGGMTRPDVKLMVTPEKHLPSQPLNSRSPTVKHALSPLILKHGRSFELRRSLRHIFT